MTRVAITGSGLFTPADAISNEELVEAFNGYVAMFNERHAAQIAAGQAAGCGNPGRRT